MNPDTERELFSKYPDLFRNKGKSPQESLMCFGCECGDGWKCILDDLFGYLSQVRESRSRLLSLKPEFSTGDDGGYLEVSCPPVVLDQVKEKYGTLRVYWHFSYDEIDEARSKVQDVEEFDRCIERYSNLVDDAVDFSEYLSSKTCEITGRPGKLYSDGWCVTLCEEEASKRFGWNVAESPSQDSSEQGST
jgi:hypothetical protein